MSEKNIEKIREITEVEKINLERFLTKMENARSDGEFQIESSKALRAINWYEKKGINTDFYQEKYKEIMAQKDI